MRRRRGEGRRRRGCPLPPLIKRDTVRIQWVYSEEEEEEEEEGEEALLLPLNEAQ